MNTHVVGYTASQKTAVIDKNNMMQYIAPQDLKSFGLIPEIIGRLPVLTYLNPLDRNALRAILTEPKNSIIKQYIKLFEMDGIKLTFEDSVFEYIVDKAVEYKLSLIHILDFPIIFASALTKQRILKVLEEARNVYENRTTKIPTARLNEEMLPLIEAYPPPSNKGKYIKIKYITQLPNTQVPSFVYFANLPQYVKEPYKRCLLYTSR